MKPTNQWLLGTLALLPWLLPVQGWASDYQWNASAYADWTAADTSEWLVGTSEPPSTPGSGDNIVTPAQFGSMGVRESYTIDDFTFDSSSPWNVYGSKGAHTLTINGTLTKEGSGLLTFRGAAGAATLSLLVNAIDVESGALALGNTTVGLEDITVSGKTQVGSGGNINLLAHTASFAGGIEMNGGGFNIYTGTGTNPGTVSAASLSGNSGNVQVFNVNNAAHALLALDGNSGSAAYGGTLSDGGDNVLSLSKTGSAIQKFSGANTYSGGTAVSGGTLLVNNTAGSGTGTGDVTVQGDAVLGGTGIIAPASGRNITVDGTLSPGDENAAPLTFDLTGESRLSFGSGSRLALTLGDLSDRVVFSSAGNWLSGSGNLTLQLTLGSGFDYSQSYVVFENVTTADFTLGGVSGYDLSHYLYSFDRIGDDYVLSFRAIPEPSEMGMLGAGVLSAGMLAASAFLRTRNRRR